MKSKKGPPVPPANKTFPGFPLSPKVTNGAGPNTNQLQKVMNKLLNQDLWTLCQKNLAEEDIETDHID